MPSSPGASESAVPVVAMQKFLFHLRAHQFEKAKALAFQSTWRAPEKKESAGKKIRPH